jgi:hypothetical protein
MPLVTVSLPRQDAALPDAARRLIRRAEVLAERTHFARCAPGYVGSDFGRVYTALSALDAEGLPTGHWLCEWGSGMGVVSCLAAMLGFEAWGIEAEAELVRAARGLAADFELPVEFVHGSYIPAEAEQVLLDGRDFGWLDTTVPSGYEEAGLAVDDFDVIFVYPWPDEEALVASLFERYARPGALLLTYHGGDDLRVRRKVRRRR